MNKLQESFECSLCQFQSRYDYFGNKPPFTRGVILLEDAYVMKDPFTSERGGFLIVGAKCLSCHKMVCCSQKCSLFYTRRFCANCSVKHVNEFPEEIKQDVLKNTK